MKRGQDNFGFHFLGKNSKVENIKEIGLSTPCHSRIQTLNPETGRKFAIKYIFCSNNKKKSL